MSRLTEKQYALQRAQMFNDYTEVDRDYPSNIFEDVLAMICVLPSVIKAYVLCR